MSEDRSEQPKGWFGKLTQAFSDEPRSREDLLSDLRQASDENLLDSEALTIMEGAMQVSDMQVREAMLPRSQMVVVEADQTPKEFLPVIISHMYFMCYIVYET